MVSYKCGKGGAVHPPLEYSRQFNHFGWNIFTDMWNVLEARYFTKRRVLYNISLRPNSTNTVGVESTVHKFYISFQGKSKAQRRIEPSSQFINLGYRYFLMYSKRVSKLGILLCVEWCIISLQFLWNGKTITWVVDGLWSSPSTVVRRTFWHFAFLRLYILK
jgi:hypothetical protein